MFEEKRYTPSEQILSEVESQKMTERLKGVDSSRVAIPDNLFCNIFTEIILAVSSNNLALKLFYVFKWVKYEFSFNTYLH